MRGGLWYSPCMENMSDTPDSTTAQAAEALAIEAESRIQNAPTQDEREYWQRTASYWWGRA